MSNDELDRTTDPSGDKRIKVARTISAEGELALMLGAHRLPKSVGRRRRRTPSLANEYYLYGNPEFATVLNEARELINANAGLSPKEIYERCIRKSVQKRDQAAREEQEAESENVIHKA